MFLDFIYMDPDDLKKNMIKQRVLIKLNCFKGSSI